MADEEMEFGGGCANMAVSLGSQSSAPDVDKRVPRYQVHFTRGGPPRRAGARLCSAYARNERYM